MKREHGCGVVSVESDTAACGHREGALQHHGRVARHPRGPEKGDALVLRTVVTELRGYSGKRDRCLRGGSEFLGTLPGTPGTFGANVKTRKDREKKKKKREGGSVW